MKDMYVEYLKQKSPSERMIRRDITRTFPEHDFFKEKNGVGQESLFNVMKVLQSVLCPDLQIRMCIRVFPRLIHLGDIISLIKNKYFIMC